MPKAVVLACACGAGWSPATANGAESPNTANNKQERAAKRVKFGWFNMVILLVHNKKDRLSQCRLTALLCGILHGAMPTISKPFAVRFHCLPLLNEEKSPLC
jgi:hypothetical protein